MGKDLMSCNERLSEGLALYDHFASVALKVGSSAPASCNADCSSCVPYVSCLQT